ncbi:MAG: hypothetical protein SCJ93_11610 [Bacillota bacterium]|nr:hypothetical protein [Bacillota bacterium]
MDIEFKYNNEHTNMVVHVCPWYDAWKTEDIFEYREPDCKYVEGYLAKGFSKDLVLQVDGISTEG